MLRSGISHMFAITLREMFRANAALVMGYERHGITIL